MTESGPNPQARIEELESRLTLADHAIGELSNEVYSQQQQLTRLDSLVNRLRDQLQQIEAAQSEKNDGDEVPPHY
jgi:uncharacterized coiled-coil protein SlyX